MRCEVWQQQKKNIKTREIEKRIGKLIKMYYDIIEEKEKTIGMVLACPRNERALISKDGDELATARPRPGLNDINKDEIGS